MPLVCCGFDWAVRPPSLLSRSRHLRRVALVPLSTDSSSSSFSSSSPSLPSLLFLFFSFTPPSKPPFGFFAVQGSGSSSSRALRRFGTTPTKGSTRLTWRPAFPFRGPPSTAVRPPRTLGHIAFLLLRCRLLDFSTSRRLGRRTGRQATSTDIGSLPRRGENWGRRGEGGSEERGKAHRIVSRPTCRLPSASKPPHSGSIHSLRPRPPLLRFLPFPFPTLAFHLLAFSSPSPSTFLRPTSIGESETRCPDRFDPLAPGSRQTTPCRRPSS